MEMTLSVVRLDTMPFTGLVTALDLALASAKISTLWVAM